MASTKSTPKGGELPLDQGATPAAPGVGPTAAEGVATVTSADITPGDDLLTADLALALGVSPATKIGTDPITESLVVSVPPATALQQLATATHFPVSSVAAVADPVLHANSRVQPKDIRPGVNYFLFQDYVTSPFNSGKVPTENSTGTRRSQTPIITRPWVVGDAIFDLSTQGWFVCTVVGAGASIDDVTFRWFASTAKESLDDWDDVWAADLDYTFDYEATATLSRTSTGTFGSAVTLPADRSAYSGWSTAIVARAAKTLFPRNATFKIDTMPPVLLDSNPDVTTQDADWQAKFAAMYVTGGVVHPSTVGALVAAANANADARTSDIYYQTASGGQLTTVQTGYAADNPGMGWDVKQADDNTLIDPLLPVDVTGPSPVTAASATAQSKQLTLSWTNPVAPTDATQIIVRRAAGATAPATPNSGTAVAVSGMATGVVDSGLLGSTQYSYAIWAADASFNLSTRVTVTQTTAA